MNTPTPSRYAPPSHASTALSEDLPPAAKSQDEHAADLFLAIKLCDADAVIRFAAKVDDLDRHFDKDFADRPLMLAARYDLPVAGFKALLARSNPRLASADGVTPLIFAAWGNKPHSAELVRLLLPLSDPLALKMGADSALAHAIAVQNIAVQNKFPTEAISLLLPASDLEQLNSDGLAPLEQARQANLDDVVLLILGEMARREAEAIASASRQAPPAALGSCRL